jgi:hypothetical protein
MPLHALLAAAILAAPKILCDDMPLPVLDRTKNRTRIARLWSYAMDGRPWGGPALPAAKLKLRRHQVRPQIFADRVLRPSRLTPNLPNRDLLTKCHRGIPLNNAMSITPKTTKGRVPPPGGVGGRQSACRSDRHESGGGRPIGGHRGGFWVELGCDS